MTMRSFEPQSTTGRRPMLDRDFLTLPERTSKPRRHGVSHVLDNGISLAEMPSIGWQPRRRASTSGSSVGAPPTSTRRSRPKLQLLSEHGVLACTGRHAARDRLARRRRAAQLMDWARAVGFPCMEVSCGSVPIARDVKSLMIETVAEQFTVLAEVGAKDPARRMCAPSSGRRTLLPTTTPGRTGW